MRFRVDVEVQHVFNLNILNEQSLIPLGQDKKSRREQQSIQKSSITSKPQYFHINFQRCEIGLIINCKIKMTLEIQKKEASIDTIMTKSKKNNSSLKATLTIDDIVAKDIDTFLINPHSKWCSELLTEVAIREGVFTMDDKEALAEWLDTVDISNHVYPYASKSTLKIAALWINWLFKLDDHYDTGKEFGTDIERVRTLMEQVLSVVTTGEIPEDTPFWRLGKVLYGWIKEETSLMWQARFVSEVSQYLFRGSFLHMKHWKENTILTLEEFIPIREWDTAGMTCLVTAELCGDCVLPPSLYYDAGMERLRHLCTKHLGLLNDIFSYNGEINNNGSVWNCVHLIMFGEDVPLTLPQSVHLAVEIVNTSNLDFEQAAREVLADPYMSSFQDIIQRYIYVLQQWMVGHVKFCQHCARYSDPLDPTAIRPESLQYLK